MWAINSSILWAIYCSNIWILYRGSTWLLEGIVWQAVLMYNNPVPYCRGQVFSSMAMYYLRPPIVLLRLWFWKLEHSTVNTFLFMSCRDLLITFYSAYLGHRSTHQLWIETPARLHGGLSLIGFIVRQLFVHLFLWVSITSISHYLVYLNHMQIFLMSLVNSRPRQFPIQTL